MNIAKSRVAFSLEPLVLPGGKTKQDMSDFINQKKEMFMVELSQNVIQQRIEELDLKNRRKAQALEDSRMQLQNDETKLMQFIQADQIKTSGTEKEAERMMNQRKASEQVDKELNMQIINMRSEIEKQKDVVFGLR